MICKNCGVECRTTEKEGEIHTSGKYACYPEAKSNDPRWPMVAVAVETDESCEDEWI